VLFRSDSYTLVGIKCSFLPFCFEPERIKYDPKIEVECDIAFVGETGIHIDDLIFDKIDSDGFIYCNRTHETIRFLLEYGEYWERAMLLAKMTKQFNVRIYKKSFGNDYCKIIQKGIIAFHRSDNNIPPRLFENMACHRATVTDDVIGIEELVTDKINVMLYKQYGFHPMLKNFDLDYESLEYVVKHLLNHPMHRDMIARNGYELVHMKHTFLNRAQQIIEMVEEL
jgi:spore maturation protein CgeB